jgi:hypothetical protein
MKKQNCGDARRLVIISWLVALLLTGSLVNASVHQFDLNGLSFGINEQTGNIVSISYPATGMILDVPQESAGLLDLAYPSEAFPTLRLASRFSTARLIKEPNALTIVWDQLGASHTNISLPDGKVRAEVKLRAAADGKSVILTCRIENHSEAAIPQILFPDLHGIQPFDGREQTQLLIENRQVAPFAGPVRQPGDASFYVDLGLTKYFVSESNPNSLHRLIIMGQRGGLSFFYKDSAKTLNRIFTHRKESNSTSLRLMLEHKYRIEPGQLWESDEVLITPFKETWTNSIFGVRRITLNGLEIWLNEENGNIVYLSSASTGGILESVPEYAGLLDVAYPVAGNESLHLSSDFSKARFEEVKDGLNIIWDQLNSAKTGFLTKNKVSAEVCLRACPDGKSVAISCGIVNDSNLPIPQVQFPRLCGLKPLDGINNTQLRLAGGVTQPFLGQPKPQEYRASGFGAAGFGPPIVENSLRWMDYGSLKSGLSIFQKKWGMPDKPDILTDRNETNMSMDLLWKHKTKIAPGRKWESGEFCLTPHRGGWAKGIEAFRNYVMQVDPPRILPVHVRDGIGCQTIWMAQTCERYPDSALYRFNDLPRIAQDAADHGINELILWGWCNYARLPITLRADLGTQEEFLEGIRKARKVGVNVAPFVSIQLIMTKYADRYGESLDKHDWTFSPEFIPNMQPYYSNANEDIWITPENKIWQQDVQESLGQWIQAGVTSFSWDVFDDKTPALLELIKKIRAMAYDKDTQSTFSGESGLTPSGTEHVDEVLDYTWRWMFYYDAQPISNVLRTPRLNCLIDDSPLMLKKAFCDGLYLNLIPRKPDMPNMTALISEKPAVSAALKETAHLRKQFLPYFVEGHILGNSVLSEPASVFVCGYQLPNKLLIIMLNDKAEPVEVSLQSSLDVWLPVANSYKVKYYNSQGDLLQTASWNTGVNWVGKSRLLPPLELALFEIETE